MKFKGMLAALLAAAAVGSMTACSDTGSSDSSESKKKVETETVAAEVDSAEAGATDAQGASSADAQTPPGGAASADSHTPGGEASADSQAPDNGTGSIAGIGSDSNSSDGSSSSGQTFEDIAKNYDKDHPEKTINALLEQGFKTAFGENMRTEYDAAESKYSIFVWQPGFAAAVNTAQGAETLDTLTSSLEAALSQMTEKIRTLDPKANVSFNFVSDEDQKTPLLCLENGKTTYNITKQ